MQHIREIIKTIELGCTAPVLAITDNDQYVVAKLKGNGQGVQCLLNELLASQLASFLGIPTPDFFVGEIDSATISSVKLSANDYGPCFCSMYISPSSTPTSSAPKYVSNCDDIYKIILLDLLICNTDRNNGNIIFMIKKPYTMYAIDYSDIFGDSIEWSDSELNTMLVDQTNLDMQVWRNNYSTYSLWLGDKMLDLTLMYNIIENDFTILTRERIMEFVEKIPVEWGRPSGIILSTVCDFIIKRLGHLNDAVNEIAIRKG